MVIGLEETLEIQFKYKLHNHLLIEGAKITSALNMAIAFTMQGGDMQQ